VKKERGDVVLTYEINLSALARTDRSKLHAHATAVVVLDTMLQQIRAEPSITGKSVVWNGVNVGQVKVRW
jgi:hypothetical protein